MRMSARPLIYPPMPCHSVCRDIHGIPGKSAGKMMVGNGVNNLKKMDLRDRGQKK